MIMTITGIPPVRARMTAFDNFVNIENYSVHIHLFMSRKYNDYLLGEEAFIFVAIPFRLLYNQIHLYSNFPLLDCLQIQKMFPPYM